MVIRHKIIAHKIVPEGYTGIVYKCSYGDECNFMCPSKSEFVRHLKQAAGPKSRHKIVDQTAIQQEIAYLESCPTQWGPRGRRKRKSQQTEKASTSRTSSTNPSDSVVGDTVIKTEPGTSESDVPETVPQDQKGVATGVNEDGDISMVLEDIPRENFEIMISDQSYRDLLKKWKSVGNQREFRDGGSRLEVAVGKDGFKATRFDGKRLYAPLKTVVKGERKRCTICRMLLSASAAKEHTVTMHGFKSHMVFCCSLCSYRTMSEEKFTNHMTSKRHIMAWANATTKIDDTKIEQDAEEQSVEGTEEESWDGASMDMSISEKDPNEVSRVVQQIPRVMFNEMIANQTHRDIMRKWGRIACKANFRDHARVEAILSRKGLVVTRFDGEMQPLPLVNEGDRKRCTICDTVVSCNAARMHAVVKHGLKSHMVYYCVPCKYKTSLEIRFHDHMTSTRHEAQWNVLPDASLEPQCEVITHTEEDMESSIDGASVKGNAEEVTKEVAREFEDMSDVMGTQYVTEGAHPVGHESQIKWLCVVCNFLTVHRRSIQMHIEGISHQTKLAEATETCLPPSPKFIKIHTQSELGKITWKCEECGEEFASKKQALLHLETEAHKQVVEKYFSYARIISQEEDGEEDSILSVKAMEDLSDIFENIFSAESVASVGHEGDAKWYCHPCQFYTLYKGNMQIHIETPKHQTNLLRPDLEKLWQLPKFMKPATIDKGGYVCSVFQCSECKKTFENKNQVKQHLGNEMHKLAVRSYYHKHKPKTPIKRALSIDSQESESSVVLGTPTSSIENSSLSGRMTMDIFEDLSDVYDNSFSDHFGEIRGYNGAVYWYCPPCTYGTIYKSQMKVHLTSRVHDQMITEFRKTLLKPLDKGPKLVHSMMDATRIWWRCIECKVDMDSKKQVSEHLGAEMHLMHLQYLSKSSPKESQPSKDVIKIISSDEESNVKKPETEKPEEPEVPESKTKAKTPVTQMYEDLSILYDKDYYGDEPIQHLGHNGIAKWYCNACDMETIYRANMMNHCAKTGHIENRNKKKVHPRRGVNAPRFIQLQLDDRSAMHPFKCTACSITFRHKIQVWEHLKVRRHRQAVKDYYQKGPPSTPEKRTNDKSPVRDCSVKLERLDTSSDKDKSPIDSTKQETSLDAIWLNLTETSTMRYDCKVCVLSAKFKTIEDLQRHKKGPHHTKLAKSKVKRVWSKEKRNRYVYFYNCPCGMQLILRGKKELQVHLDGKFHKETMKNLPQKTAHKDLSAEKTTKITPKEDSLSNVKKEPDDKNLSLEEQKSEKVIEEEAGCRYEEKLGRVYYICGICDIRILCPAMPSPAIVMRHRKNIDHKAKVDKLRTQPEEKNVVSNDPCEKAVPEIKNEPEEYQEQSTSMPSAEITTEVKEDESTEETAGDEKYLEEKANCRYEQRGDKMYYICGICNIRIAVPYMPNPLLSGRHKKTLKHKMNVFNFREKVELEKSKQIAVTESTGQVVNAPELGVVKTNGGFCELCNVGFSDADKWTHYQSYAHKMKRKIMREKEADMERKGLWHCQFCNVTVATTARKSHTCSAAHQLAKLKAKSAASQKARSTGWTSLQSKVAKKVEETVTSSTAQETEDDLMIISSSESETSSSKREYYTHEHMSLLPTGRWYCKICKVSVAKGGKLGHLQTGPHKQFQYKSEKNDLMEKKWYCKACNVYQSVFYKEKHVRSRKHKMAMQRLQLVRDRKFRLSKGEQGKLYYRVGLGWHCIPCNITIDDYEKRRAHLASMDHKQKFVEYMALKFQENPEDHSMLRPEKRKPPTTVRVKQPVGFQNWHCDVCNVTFFTTSRKSMHLTGTRHKINLQKKRLKSKYANKMKLSKKTLMQLYIRQGQGWHCVPCNITLSRYEERHKHLSTVQHETKLLEWQEKNIAYLPETSPEKSDYITVKPEMVDEGYLGSVETTPKASSVSKPSALPWYLVEPVDGQGEFECKLCEISAKNRLSWANHLKASWHLENVEKQEQKEREEAKLKAQQQQQQQQAMVPTVIQLPQPGRRTRRDKTNTYCEACDKTFESREWLIMHFRQGEHKEKARQMKVKHIEAAAKKPRVSYLIEGFNDGETFQCLLCQVITRNLGTWQNHLSSWKHNANVAQHNLQQRSLGTVESGAAVASPIQVPPPVATSTPVAAPATPTTSGESKSPGEETYIVLPKTPKESFQCKLCNVSIRNEFTWRFHLKSVKHKDNVKSFKAAHKENRTYKEPGPQTPSSSTHTPVKQEPRIELDSSSDAASTSDTRPSDFPVWRPFDREAIGQVIPHRTEALSYSHTDSFGSGGALYSDHGQAVFPVPVPVTGLDTGFNQSLPETRRLGEQRVSELPPPPPLTLGTSMASHTRPNPSSSHANTINININLPGSQQYDQYGQQGMSHYGSHHPARSPGKSRKRPAVSPVHHETPASLRPKRKSAEDAENRIKDMSFLDRQSTTNIIKMVQAKERQDHDLTRLTSAHSTPHRSHSPKGKAFTPVSHEFVVLDDVQNPHTTSDAKGGFQPMILDAGSIDPRQWQVTDLTKDDKEHLSQVMDSTPAQTSNTQHEASTSKGTTEVPDFPFATEAIADLFNLGDGGEKNQSTSIKQENVDPVQSVIKTETPDRASDDMSALQWHYTAPSAESHSTSTGYGLPHGQSSGTKEPEFVDLTSMDCDEDI